MLYSRGLSLIETIWPGAFTKIPGVNAPYDYLEDYAEEDRVELVVKMKAFADETALWNILADEGLLDVDSEASEGRDDNGMRRLRFAEDTDLDAVYDYLRDADEVDFVEPNLNISVSEIASSTMWGSQWGPQKIGANEAWEHLPDNPRQFLVGVIDTGIDYTHPDLADAMWQNEGEILVIK